MGIRLGHEVGLEIWKHFVLVTGLFHAKIADTHGTLLTHFGMSSTRSPGSLAFHNTCLDWLPIVLTYLPSFWVCRDLIMVSLYAWILHCLLLLSNEDSLQSYVQKLRHGPRSRIMQTRSLPSLRMRIGCKSLESHNSQLREERRQRKRPIKKNIKRQTRRLEAAVDSTIVAACQQKTCYPPSSKVIWSSRMVVCSCGMRFYLQIPSSRETRGLWYWS